MRKAAITAGAFALALAVRYVYDAARVRAYDTGHADGTRQGFGEGFDAGVDAARLWPTGQVPAPISFSFPIRGGSE